MRLKFWQQDSLYKIFKTIEKIPTTKNIEIFIDAKNSFYDNIWWWKQLVDLLNSKNLEYVFLYNDLSLKDYFKELWVNSNFQEKDLFTKIVKSIYNVFFSAKKYHGYIVSKWNYISYAIIVWEIIWVVTLLYFFYSLISPSANIFIKPSYSVDEIIYNFRYYPAEKSKFFSDSKYISIPYNSGSFEVKYTLSTAVQNVKYMQNPSRWSAILINTSDKDFSLVANTRFVTDDWILFKSKNWVNLPAANASWASQVEVQLEAMDIDTKWNIIWERWNISKDTKIYIRNLKDSFYLKNVYAIPKDNFAWWETKADWTVQPQDIEFLKARLSKYVYWNKMLLLKNQLSTQEDKIALNFDDIVKVNIVDYDIKASSWDNKPMIEWTINALVNYKFINWADMLSWYNEYINQRVSSNMQLVDIDKSSLLFFDKTNFDNIFVVPTKVDIIRGYNFGKDINWIKDEIKSKIIGKTLAESQDIILSYPEIDVAIVKLSPPWYNIIPSVRSRIKININK